LGKIEWGEGKLNVLEFYECADELGADAAEIIRAAVKARPGRAEMWIAKFDRLPNDTLTDTKRP
jgi:hypothetical protein